MSYFKFIFAMEIEFMKYGYEIVHSNYYSLTVSKEDIKYRINIVGRKLSIFTNKEYGDFKVRYNNEIYYKLCSIDGLVRTPELVERIINKIKLKPAI
jgi:hypothetical protein